MARTPLKITLYRSEIIYDIQNKTMLTARSRNNGTNYEAVANMQANNDDENLNQILRSIGNAWTALKSAVSEYADLGITPYNRDDASSDPESTWQSYSNNPGIYDATDKLFDQNGQLNAYLIMPENYNVSAKDLIATAMHQYIVNRAIGEWFTITNPSEATTYYTMAQGNLVELREACSRRKRPVRITV